MTKMNKEEKIEIRKKKRELREKINEINQKTIDLINVKHP